MMVPTRRAAAIAALLAFPLILAGLYPHLIIIAVAGDVALLAVYLKERSSLRRLDVSMTPGKTVNGWIGSDSPVTYVVANRSSQPVRLSARQPVTGDWDVVTDRADLEIPAGHEAVLTFILRPRLRGNYRLPEPELSISGGSGLFRMRWLVKNPASALIYPSPDALAGAERMRRGIGLSRAGTHRHRQVGTGSDFERLRSYEPDDDYRHINWKTAARQGKPVTNVFQAERGRDVMLCVDVGRMMGQMIGGSRVIDRAVEAGIVMTRIVAREGDRPGLAVFHDKVDTYIPAKGGKAGVKRIADALAGLDATPAHTSFAALAAAIGARQNRRSLIIVFTDMNDPQAAGELAAAMRLMRGKHAALVVGMRDSVLETVASAPTFTRKEMCRSLAAGVLAEERDAAARDLRKIGVVVADCHAANLVSSVVDRYLFIKAGRMLD